MHKLSGELAAVDQYVMEDWTPVLNDFLQWYLPQDICSASEIGLYYNLLPNRTLTVKDDSCKGRKGSKEWLNVLLCSSMCGSDKMKQFVIRKSPAAALLLQWKQNSSVYINQTE